MKKELRPVHDVVSCDVCGRTILKGERTEPYLAPGGDRYQVCDLCYLRAEHHGWIRESAADNLPARMPRAEPRRGVLGLLRRRRPAERQGGPNRGRAPNPDEAALAEQEARYGGAADVVEPADEAEPEPAPPPPPRERPRPKDPRHVRAVPTTTVGKVERAVDLFNGSDHQRTIAGLARTLGRPWVSIKPDADSSSEVSLVVAWELSWYRFRIDLGDEDDPVAMLAKGDEVHELDEDTRDWNAALDADGRVISGG